MSEHYCMHKDGMCELDVDEAYTEGYKQGKKDREKELSELPNEYSEKLWKIAHDRGYQQGKTDGAREFAELLKKKFNEFIDYDDDGEQTFESNPDLVWIAIDEVLAEWQK